MSEPNVDEHVQAPTGPFATAVGWSFVMNAVRLASTIGTSIVLAALLGPRAFGIVALALIYIALLQLLMQQGFVAALIQRPHLNRRHLDSAFWLTMGASVILAAASVLLAGWWAGVNDAPEAREVIWALSILVLVKGLVTVQEALLRRQMRFRELAVRTTVASGAGAAVGLAYTIIQPTMWALVAQQLTTNVVGAIVLWSVSGWRPRLAFWTTEARSLLGFAGKSSLSGLGSFVNSRIDALLVGLYFGAGAVGLYRLAARLVESAIEFTVEPLQSVALPEFSRQGDSHGLRERYRSLVMLSVAIRGPVMATIFASAKPLMQTMGGEWADAITALQLLSIVGLVRAMTMLTGPALLAVGRPGALAVLTWLAAGLSAVSFVIAGALLSDRTVDVQVAGMAASRAILYALILLPLGQSLFVSRIVGVGMIEFIRIVTPTVATCGLAATLGTVSSELLLTAGVPSVAVLAVVGVGTLATSGSLAIAVNPAARTTASRIWPRVRLAMSCRHA